MEIERKFLADPSSLSLSDFPHTEMTQGYLFTDPVLRIRQSGSNYILTVKSVGLLEREEYELHLSEEQYRNLSRSVQGNLIEKTRYRIPCPPYTIELDLFHGSLDGLCYAEVEFPSKAEALAFNPPAWFLCEVTEDGSFTNAELSRLEGDRIPEFLARVSEMIRRSKSHPDE